MPTTTRFGVVTPDDGTANDFADAMGDLAEAITSQMAGYSQGLHASRPAAGKAGRFYNTIDSSVNGGLFYDNGTTWLRITASPWISWVPTIGLANGGGGVATGTTRNIISPAICQYRINPGSEVQFFIEDYVSFTGTQQYVQLTYTSPIASARATQATGVALNELAIVSILDQPPFGNVIDVAPTPSFINPGHTGQWYVDGYSRYVRVSGTYSV